MGSIPGLGKFPEEGHCNTLQYSCREIPWTEVPGMLWFTGLQRAGSQLKQLSMHAWDNIKGALL